MSEPTRHHYVPRIYLQSFSNHQGHVEAYDKKYDHAFHARPAQLARKSDYNTVTSSSGGRDRQTIESFYGQHESGFPSLLAEIQAGKIEFLSGIRLMNFAALQFIRSPATRNGIERLMSNLAPIDEEALEEAGVNEHGRKLLERARNGDHSAADEMSLTVSAETLKIYSSLLEHLGYVAFKIPETDPLITCDSPCILTGLVRGKNGWRLTVNSPQTRMIFFYPLTPNLFIFGDTKLSVGGAPSFRFREFPRASNVVKWLNRTAFLRSDRHLFSHRPDLIHPDRLGSLVHSPHAAVKELAHLFGKITGAIYSTCSMT